MLQQEQQERLSQLHQTVAYLTQAMLHG
jgi:hypothetical protein